VYRQDAPLTKITVDLAARERDFIPERHGALWCKCKQAWSLEY
jgi:hypothetical protein